VTPGSNSGWPILCPKAFEQITSLISRGGTMIQFASSVKRFLVSEDGPTAVEYAVMLALIIVVCLTAIQAVGTNASTTFTNVSGQLGGS
jgi:pilus assembly protein Flp/PilA